MVRRKINQNDLLDFINNHDESVEALELRKAKEANVDQTSSTKETSTDEDPKIIFMPDGLLRLVDRKQFLERYKEDKPKNAGGRVLDDFKGLVRPKNTLVATYQIISEVECLYSEFPNFHEVIDEVRNYAYKSMITNTPFSIHPFLFVGPPGIGKSAFMLRLSDVLKVPVKIFNMAGDKDTVKLRGLSQFWSTGAPSELVKFASNSEYANSVVLFDELDKAGAGFNADSGSNAGNVQEVLLTLLEKSTSSRFEDAYIGTPTINLSYLNFMATANTLERIDEPLISRFQVFKIEKIKREQLLEIIKNIYLDVRVDFKAEDFLESYVHDYVCAQLADSNLSIREIKRLIMRAMCKALIRAHTDNKRVTLSLQDITTNDIEEEPKRSIGFI